MAVEQRYVYLEEEFLDLVARASRTYLSWDDLTHSPLPRATSATQVWEALDEMRFRQSIQVPFHEIDGYTSWYQPTLHITQGLERIRCVCLPGSPLLSFVESSPENPLVAGFLTSEAMHMAKHDNILIDVSRARELLEKRCAPRNDGERLLVNIFEAMADVGQLAREPLSIATVRSLYDRLVAGVHLEGVDPVFSDGNAQEALSTRHPDIGSDKLDTLCGYADGRGGDPHDHPVVRAVFLRTALSYFRPLPALNNAAAGILFAVACHRAQMPLLATMSSSKALFNWLENKISDTVKPVSNDCVSDLRGTYPETINHKKKRSDFTAFVTLAVDLLLEALDELAREVEGQRTADARLVRVVENNLSINRRQQAILSHAIRNPDTTFVIKTHQVANQIAYATARSDFLQLVNRGYLEKRKQGKEFVFMAGPGFRKQLEQTQ